MPTLFKNGKNYSGTSVSLTQAEYDALTETQKNDGTVYFITDSDAVLDASDVALGSGTVETLAGSIATIETSPATANHSVGDYIVYNGQLYKVTTAITAGQSLTVGTNISATTVMNSIKTVDVTVTINANANYGTANVPVGVNTMIGASLVYSDDVYYTPPIIAFRSSDSTVHAKLTANTTTARTYTVRVLYRG